MITRPILPSKAGYVERVDENGEHYYAPTPETAARQLAEKIMQTEQCDADAMAIDHEYRLTLLELGVTKDAVQDVEENA